MNVLVIGGAGYIGSHTVRMLLQRGHRVVIIDNLCKGHRRSVPAGAEFYKVDIGDTERLRNVFRNEPIDAVMHFAAFIEVGESMVDPKKYYTNNLVKTINLLNVMLEFGIKNIIFSSTAAIFGDPREVPIREDLLKDPVNVYGRTKLTVENVLSDYGSAYGLKSVCLRYFNAAGAGFGIGEDHDPESHLIPLVLQTALGKRGVIKIFGTDYPTEDGTCVRDYIHVIDLGEAHILALEKLIGSKESDRFNLGSGKGYSVREVIDESCRVTGERINVEEDGRRPGDSPVLVADSSRILERLGWRPRFELKDIIESAWDWHSKNPEGFKDGLE